MCQKQYVAKTDSILVCTDYKTCTDHAATITDSGEHFTRTAALILWRNTMMMMKTVDEPIEVNTSTTVTVIAMPYRIVSVLCQLI